MADPTPTAALIRQVYLSTAADLYALAAFYADEMNDPELLRRVTARIEGDGYTVEEVKISMQAKYDTLRDDS